MIEVRAGTDDEVHQPAIHHLDHASTDAGGRHSTGDRETNRRLLVGREHFFREDPAGFRQPGGIERLKALIDEMSDFLAALWAIETDGLARERVLRSRGAWMAVRHRM